MERFNVKNLLLQNEYDFISRENKTFIIAFDIEMERLGYTSGKIISASFTLFLLALLTLAV